MEKVLREDCIYTCEGWQFCFFLIVKFFIVLGEAAFRAASFFDASCHHFITSANLYRSNINKEGRLPNNFRFISG